MVSSTNFEIVYDRRNKLEDVDTYVINHTVN